MIGITVPILVIQFFCYSVLGWCMEVALKYRQFHRFINRGFLIGPYCPIYGAGAVFITVFVGRLMELPGGNVPDYISYPMTFALSFVMCGALEYFVSWFMEKCFHARWWDYSTKPMNLHGRIWIGNLILFGLGGIAIVKWLDPPYFRWMVQIPADMAWAVSAVIAAGMLGDCILSTLILLRVRSEIDGVELDNSEEISRKIHELLHSRPALVRRLGRAFPNMTVSPQLVVEKMRKKEEEIRESMRAKEEEIRGSMRAKEEEIRGSMRAKEEEIRETMRGKKEEVVEAIKGRMQ